jgi:hypothetical protein
MVILFRVAYMIFFGRGGNLADDLLFTCACICDAATRILVNNYFLEVQ